MFLYLSLLKQTNNNKCECVCEGFFNGLSELFINVLICTDTHQKWPMKGFKFQKGLRRATRTPSHEIPRKRSFALKAYKKKKDRQANREKH